MTAALQGSLMVDVAGTWLTAEDRHLLRQPEVGGLIIFARNIEHPRQVRELSAAIRAVRPDLLLAVDQEGGRVQRLRQGFVRLPAMRALADNPNAEYLAEQCGWIMATEVLAVGLDLSFAPVLDLDYQRSAVVGTRAFEGDPERAAVLAGAFIRGMNSAGMAATGKHFPGHGWAEADSHVAIPNDERSLEQIRANDLVPFARLSKQLAAVMPAHVIYSKVDDRPAGFSARWIQDILRGQLGFDGVVCTDDLSMAAARQLGGRELSYSEAVLTALQAGCDLTLLCNRSTVNGGAELDEVLDHLAEVQLKGRWLPDEASEERRLTLLPRTPARPWDELVRARDYMQALDRLP